MNYYTDLKIEYDDGDFVWMIWYNADTEQVTFAETVEAADEETYIAYVGNEVPEWLVDVAIEYVEEYY